MSGSTEHYKSYSKGDFRAYSKIRIQEEEHRIKKKQWMATVYDYNGLGEMYLANRNFLDAKKAFLKAIEINPEVRDPYINMIKYSKYLNEHEEAFKIFDKLISMNKGTNSFEWELQKSLYLLDIKRFEEAIQPLNKLIELYPENSNLYVAKGKCLYGLKQTEDAIKCFDTAINLDENGNAYNSKGFVFKELNKNDEAIKYYKMAEEFNLKYYKIEEIEQMADIYKALNNNEEAIKNYKIGLEFYIASNSIDLALKTATKIFLILKELNKNEEASQSYDFIIQQFPSCAAAYLFKGQGLFELKEYENSIQCLNAAIELEPNNPLYYCYIGKAFYETNRYDECLNSFNKAIAYDTNYSNDSEVKEYIELASKKSNAIDFVNKGKEIVQGNSNNFDDAIKFFDSAIELDPNYSRAYFFKAHALAAMNKDADSIELYNKAIQLEPNLAEAFYSKANILLKMNKYEDAIECYNKTIEISPNYASAYLNKSFSLRSLNKLAESVKCCDQLIEMIQDHPRLIGKTQFLFDAYLNKGYAYAALKMYNEAILFFNKALELKPRDEDAQTVCNNAIYELQKYNQLQNKKKGSSTCSII